MDKFYHRDNNAQQRANKTAKLLTFKITTIMVKIFQSFRAKLLSFAHQHFNITFALFIAFLGIIAYIVLYVIGNIMFAAQNAGIPL